MTFFTNIESLIFLTMLATFDFFYHLDNLDNFEELRQSFDYFCKFADFDKLYNFFVAILLIFFTIWTILEKYDFVWHFGIF